MDVRGPAVLDDEERAELQAWRNGHGQLAQDPMHAGQLIHQASNPWDEAQYYLQITHAGLPLWHCAVCSKVTLSSADGAPESCVGCNSVDTLGPMLYPRTVACRSWRDGDGGQYDGPCLIAGSDGCQCIDEMG